MLLIVGSLFLSGCMVQAAPKKYRVGILSGVDFFIPTIDGFKAKMTELGYVEGENIVYDIQRTGFDPAKYQQILDKFVADKVDLIFVYPTEASLEAKAATQGTNIPVLFTNANIEGVDLVNSVREPGGNITGVRYPGPDLSVKRLEVMHELAPQAKRIWIPYQKDYPIVASQLEVLYPAAEAMGITLIEAPAANIAEVEADLRARASSDDIGIDAILVIDGPLVATVPGVFAMIGEFASEHNIPVGGILLTEGGYESIYGLATDNIEVGAQAAPLADKIFKGISAGSIPVVSAQSYIYINYKAAQKLGLAVPESLLSVAKEVIR
jgi:putative ABC transport system substrate-binding protein